MLLQQGQNVRQGTPVIHLFWQIEEAFSPFLLCLPHPKSDKNFRLTKHISLLHSQEASYHQGELASNAHRAVTFLFPESFFLFFLQHRYQILHRHLTQVKIHNMAATEFEKEEIAGGSVVFNSIFYLIPNQWKHWTFKWCFSHLNHSDQVWNIQISSLAWRFWE